MGKHNWPVTNTYNYTLINVWPVSINYNYQHNHNVGVSSWV